MTVNEAIEVIRRTTMGGFGIPVDVQGVRRGGISGEVDLSIYVTLGPVKNACGEGPQISVSDNTVITGATVEMLTPEELVRHFVWPAIERIIIHEAEENFRVDGIRVRDPHAKAVR